MTKEELIKEIDKVIIKEGVVPIYGHHLREIVLWCKSSNINKRHMIDNMDTLIKNSKKHKRMFEKIKKIILKEDINNIFI